MQLSPITFTGPAYEPVSNTLVYDNGYWSVVCSECGCVTADANSCSAHFPPSWRGDPATCYECEGAEPWDADANDMDGASLRLKATGELVTVSAHDATTIYAFDADGDELGPFTVDDFVPAERAQ